ncbi:P-loop containing nucleoside triphosphate hydrolase protein [Scheffersomyces xylosifermentans]|uniref:P-loop containing nucleoside triphosphate hydrolase protein n=1 Tax=Scheffersomyces xylosifermentans TaxID=1304137 RepID=UPI00315C5935
MLKTKISWAGICGRSLNGVFLPIPRFIRPLSTNFHDHRPTIYALSTKMGRAALGVVRVSGPQSIFVYNKLTRTKTKPKHRLASVRKLYSPSSGILLDEALTVFFKAPNTYTGEDLLELHLHGGTAIIKSVLNSIRDLHDPNCGVNIRYAENGEFSQRAFINGRFDLTEIEGIRELIDAETETQRIASLSSLTGHTKQIFVKWREEILNNIALMTTLIDFGEDQDLEEAAQLFQTVEENIKTIQAEIEAYLNKVRSSEILLRGIKMILLGPPNAGKSSLLNFLANEDAAIVSDIAGTTRDIIDVPLDINGYKVVIGDTAGIRDRETADKIEVEGMRRAIAKSYSCDLILAVLPLEEDNSKNSSKLLDHLKSLSDLNRPIIVVLNKEDLVKDPNLKHSLLKHYASELKLDLSNFHVVSCLTGVGIDELNETLNNTFKTITLSETTDPIIISSRAQDILVNDVLHGFEEFCNWKHQDDVVLATESLKQSVEGIGKITGDAIGIEEILGVVFSSFCIGK